VRWIVVFLALLSLPALVTGDEVYRWVDEGGILHFTDDPAAVPEDYRVKAESREMPGRQPGRSLEEVTNEENEGILIEDDLKEKDEAWWRSRAEKWREKLQTSYDDYERARLRYNTVATEFNASNDPDKRKELKAELDEMQAEMERFRDDIEKGRRMTEEVLPSQAEKAGKPPEWVR
jgi:hypothetical protein